jgi:hypothetical protein
VVVGSKLIIHWVDFEKTNQMKRYFDREEWLQAGGKGLIFEYCGDIVFQVRKY